MKTVKTSWYRMSVSVRWLRQSAPGATTPGCLCSTKSGVALHIAPPWKTKLVPLPITSLTPVTNSSPCWPPEPSIEAPPPSSAKPSGTGTHYPWKWWRPPPLTLSCQGYQTEELPTVTAPPPPPPHLPLCVCVCVCVFFLRTSTTANTPGSYRRQKNRPVDCWPLNDRRIEVWTAAMTPTGSSPCKEGPVQQATVLKLGDSTADVRLWFRESVQSGSVAPWVDIHCNRCFGSLLFQSAFPRRSVRFGVNLLPATHAHTHTHRHAGARAHTYTRMHAHTHARRHTRARTHAYIHTHTHTHTHTHKHAYACTHTCTQTSTHSHTHSRACAPPPPHPPTHPHTHRKNTHEQMLTNF